MIKNNNKLWMINIYNKLIVNYNNKITKIITITSLIYLITVSQKKLN